MHLTAELVALVERTEPDPGPEPGTTEHTDDNFEAMATTVLAEYNPEQLWIFAYGSLIWNPEFEVEEQRRAVAHGWHRAFCLKLTRWRGTRELPALMLALDRGGTCVGIAFRLPRGRNREQVVQLLKREIDANPPTNIPRWIEVSTTEGRIRALAFVASPKGSAYAGRRPSLRWPTCFAARPGIGDRRHSMRFARSASWTSTASAIATSGRFNG
jgi:cation transport protein ChaC